MRILKAVTGLMLCAALAACGGGGGGSTPAASNTVNMSGVVTKGPVSKAKVYAWGLDASGKKILPAFAITSTSSNGSYKLPPFSYNGSILIETEGGTYTDEATGSTMANPGLKAVLPSASGTVSLPVTPLTHLAFKCASTAGLTTSQINNANAVVRSAFGIDITNTTPINATDSAEVAAATQQQVQYGVALAAVSQMGFSAFLNQVSGDLSGATPTLSTTTKNQISAAITQLQNAEALPASPAINTAVTAVNTTISNNTGTPIIIGQNATDVAKAKAIVQDLRNTALSIYDYQTGTMTSVVQTPFAATASDIQTNVAPELSAVAGTVGQALQYGITEGAPVQGSNGLTYTVTGTGTTRTVTVQNASSVTVATLNLTVNSLTAPSSAAVTGEITTPNGTATINANAAFTLDQQTANPTSISLYGEFVTKNASNAPVFTCDFGTASNKIAVTFGTNPASNDIYPTSIAFNGEIKTAAVDIKGSLSMPTLVFNTSADFPIPSSVTITGSIAALNSNGFTLNGSFEGILSNPAVIGTQITSTNFPHWTATYTGSIAANSGFNIQSTLTASMSQYEVINFTAQFQRTRPDSTHFTLSATGSVNVGNDTATATITNQDGLVIALNFDKAQADSFTGSIKANGSQVAAIYMVKSVPTVKYGDNYLESIF